MPLHACATNLCLLITFLTSSYFTFVTYSLQFSAWLPQLHLNELLTFSWLRDWTDFLSKTPDVHTLIVSKQNTLLPNVCLTNTFSPLFMCCAVLNRSVMSDSLRHRDCSPSGSFVHGDSPGKNTGVGCHTLLQGIFPTQELNQGLLHCRWTLYFTSWGNTEALFITLITVPHLFPHHQLPYPFVLLLLFSQNTYFLTYNQFHFCIIFTDTLECINSIFKGNDLSFIHWCSPNT